MTSLIAALRRARGRGPGTAVAWVTADLAIAAAPAREEWPRIAALGIRSVAEVRSEAADDAAALSAAGLLHRRFALDEGAAPAPEDLGELARWIEVQLALGPVLVHCREGRGRSALAVCAALVRLGHTAAGAFELVQRARPAAELNDAQIAALTRYAAEGRGEADDGD